jgi:hypothetical protein
MLLRDYFASDIANGYVRFMGCDPDARGQICDLQGADTNAEAIARSAYKIADAMLLVREEKKDEPEPAPPAEPSPGTWVQTGERRMNCPECGAWTTISETRLTIMRYRRRRECGNGHKFTTEEVVVSKRTT